MDINKIIQVFNRHLTPLGYERVERSNLISPYFVGEFNLSGAHSYLIPAIQKQSKVDIDSISVVDLVVRNVDSEIVGISNNHLLLFEMGVFGSFGYIEDIKSLKYKQFKTLFTFFEEIGISKKSIYITVCGGDYFIEKYFEEDNSSIKILKELGINESNIIKTKGRRNFMLSRGLDRLAGYNIEFFIKKRNAFLEIASSNIYEYLNKISYLEKTINSGVGCGVGFERLSYALSNCTSIYEIEPFKSIISKLKENYVSNANFELVKSKLYRIVEHTKAIIFIVNDNIKFDNSPQGKILKRYVSKVKSELNYISLDKRLFLEIMFNGIMSYYVDRYNIKLEVFNLILNKLSD